MQVNIIVRYGDNDIDISKVNGHCPTIGTNLNDPARILELLDNTVAVVKKAINAGN